MSRVPRKSQTLYAGKDTGTENLTSDARKVCKNDTATRNNKEAPLDMLRERLMRRYLKKDEHGGIVETPDQMYHRVANTIAQVETRYGKTASQIKVITDRFCSLMVNGVFLPNSPTLMNCGRKDAMLSACFVLPVEDSIESIFDTVKNAAVIQKAGGGTGFCFDKLRPAGDIVASSGGTTSGPISFWRVYSVTTDTIQQGAFRRGANMGMMSIEHPDILKFIYAKRSLDAFTNFNISVKVPDSFMEKLYNEPQASHIVTNPRTKKKYVIPRSVNLKTYTLDDLVPVDGSLETDCYIVRQIWDSIIVNAHATGEPGLCFIDRVNEDNPTPNLGQIEATNPCGEQPLLPYEACNLGSINVSKFVTQDSTDLDWKSLAHTILLAVRFLDNVIDASNWPVPEIREKTLGNRKIGLGIMGFADTLVLLRIRYNSQKAVKFASKLAWFIQKHAHDASEKLAKERGSFPNWAGSIWDTKYHRPMRNATCVTIAPTGSISLLAGCNGGIEPFLKIAKRRDAQDCQKGIRLQPIIEEIGAKEGWLSEKVRNLLSQGILPKDIPEIPKKLAEVLVTAHQISPEWHLRIQTAFQEYVDNAVSKTVNLPPHSSVEDVDKVFRLAFEFGCKGTTVYRDASRVDEEQIIASSGESNQTKMLLPRPRVYRTNGQTTKFRTGCGTLFVSVNRDAMGLCEVFANLGKAGGCPSQSEATCRAVSVALRCGVDPKTLIEQLKGIRCLSTITRKRTTKGVGVLSCPDAIARAIEEALELNYELEITPAVNRCPECGSVLRREEGCNQCDNCWYVKCG